MYSDPTADAALNDYNENVEIDDSAGREPLDYSVRSPLKSFLADYVGRTDNPIPIRALLGCPHEITDLAHAVSIIAAYANTLSADVMSTLEEYQRELAAEKARPYEKAFRDKVLASDWKFQHIIGPYIVDFFRGRTVIELDGWTHERTETQFLDKIKDRYLQRCGYTVRRITLEQAEEAARLGKDDAVERGLGLDKDWVRNLPHPA